MIISVRAKPGSKKPGVEIQPDGCFVVKVAARPIEGKANDAIVRALSKHLRVGVSQIVLIAGSKGKIKKFEIPDSSMTTT